MTLPAPSVRIDVLTLFPEFIQAAAAVGVVGRAQQRGLLEVATWNPRDFTHDNYRRVDERTFGGGPGMVLSTAPLRETLAAVIGFLQFVALDHGAHRAIDDQDAFGEGALQCGDALRITPWLP